MQQPPLYVRGYASACRQLTTWAAALYAKQLDQSKRMSTVALRLRFSIAAVASSQAFAERLYTLHTALLAVHGRWIWLKATIALYSRHKGIYVRLRLAGVTAAIGSRSRWLAVEALN